MCRAEHIHTLLERSGGFYDHQKRSQPHPPPAWPGTTRCLLTVPLRRPRMPGLDPAAASPPPCPWTSWSLPAVGPPPGLGEVALLREASLSALLHLPFPHPSLSLILDHGHHTPITWGRPFPGLLSTCSRRWLLEVRDSPPHSPVQPPGCK